jgi:NADP-dependent 3-hydroxy acid dehydrogenase YdfG/acyl carrier protein
MQKLPVMFAIDRAGIVGEDGETHQGVLDISYLRSIPNITILAPKDMNEFRMMLKCCFKFSSPVAIRYPRGGDSGIKFYKYDEINNGKWEMVKEGSKVAILGVGKMVQTAYAAAEKLCANNINAAVINCRFIKPMDTIALNSIFNNYDIIFTLEDNYISGGFGSLGQITAKWMVEQGARHIILFGRAKVSENNPADKKKLQFIKELEQKGAIVEQVSLDVQNEQEVYKFFNELKEKKNGVIGGIFHTAGVLRDELMTTMTQQQFDEVFDTKARGAWNLSNCTWNENLDFFVTYSSASAVVTSVGQTNYAAGNSFMDGLALYRRASGRPAQSIGWGPWGVGMIKDRNLTEHYKRVRGMEPIYAGTGMQALERVLGQDHTHVVICGVNWPQALTNFPNNPPLFNYLAEEMAEETSGEEDVNLIDALVFLEDDEKRLERLMDNFVDIVSEITYISAESINKEEPLIAIGVDSIIATEIRNKINEKFGITIAITDILGGLSLSKIAEKSFVLLAPQIEGRQKELEIMLAELDNMSEEEVKNLLVN